MIGDSLVSRLHYKSTSTSKGGFNWFDNWVDDVNSMKGFPQAAKEELIKSVKNLRKKFPKVRNSHTDNAFEGHYVRPTLCTNTDCAHNDYQ